MADLSGEAAQRIKRWMYLWIGLGTVIVLVVAGFLFAIANELESVDEGLDRTQAEVQGAEGDVKSLPDHIQDVNAALSDIDQELDPLPRLANKVIVNLDSIDVKLGSIDTTLESTERKLDTTLVRLRATADVLGSIDASLGDTVGALIDTEGVLTLASSDLASILGLAAQIERRLELAQEFDSLGTNGIWRRVRFLNGGRLVERRNPNGLRAIRRDTGNVIRAVDETNKHLESTCQVIPQLGEVLPPGTQLPPLVPTRDAVRAAPRQHPNEPPPPDDGPPC